MTPEKFAEGLKQFVVEDNLSTYKNLLDTTKKATDSVWLGILPIYKELSIEQKASFLNFIKQVEINTISNVLGVLDGSSYFNMGSDSFCLTVSSENEPINGDLQDIFLAITDN